MKQENIFKKCTNLTRTPYNMDEVLMIDTIMEIEVVYIRIYKDYKYKNKNQYKSIKQNSNQLKTL